VKRILLFFLVSLLCSCASVSEQNIKNAEYHYQLGTSYLNNNNIQPAFVQFQKALELDPNNKDIHEMLGVIYLTKLEDYPKAIHHFKEALDIDENFSEAANNLGNAYVNMGKPEKAIQSYKRALSNPQYQNAALAFNNLGMVYYKLSRFDEAIDAFKDALRRYSDFHAPYYGLALSYNAKGQYGDAATAMTRAIELDPYYKGDREKAVEDLMEKRLRAEGDQKKDIADYLEIIQY
jgi:type IV pilus assembly protein PilF